MTTEQQLREALKSALDAVRNLHDNGNFDNGVYDSTGSICEGIVSTHKYVSSIIAECEAALALPAGQDEEVDEDNLRNEISAAIRAPNFGKYSSGEPMQIDCILKAIRPYLRAKPDAGLEKIRFKKAAHPLKSPGWIEAIDACITIAPQHTRAGADVIKKLDNLNTSADHVQEMNTSEAPAGKGVVDENLGKLISNAIESGIKSPLFKDAIIGTSTKNVVDAIRPYLRTQSIKADVEKCAKEVMNRCMFRSVWPDTEEGSKIVARAVISAIPGVICDD